MPTHISWKSDVEKTTKIGIDTYFVDNRTCRNPRKKKAALFSWTTAARKVYESDRASNCRGLRLDRLYTETAVCLFFVGPGGDLCPVTHEMYADFAFRGCLFSCAAQNLFLYKTTKNLPEAELLRENPEFYVWRSVCEADGQAY